MRSCPIFRSTYFVVVGITSYATPTGAGGREGGTCLAVTCMRKKNWCEAFAHTQSGPSRSGDGSARSPLPRLTLTPQQTAHATVHMVAQGAWTCMRSISTPHAPSQPLALSPHAYRRFTPTGASRLGHRPRGEGAGRSWMASATPGAARWRRRGSGHDSATASGPWRSTAAAWVAGVPPLPARWMRSVRPRTTTTTPRRRAAWRQRQSRRACGRSLVGDPCPAGRAGA